MKTLFIFEYKVVRNTPGAARLSIWTQNPVTNLDLKLLRI